MNRFIESNKLWLSLLGLAIVIVLLAFVFRPKSVEYQTNTNQALNLMNDAQAQIAISDLAGKQLIDIRSSELFAQGHPENAINIPVRNLLDKESIKLFDQLLDNGQIAVLYGSNELQAASPCLLLQQMGYNNLKLFKGGITTNGEFSETTIPSTEVSVVDANAFRIKPEEIKTSDTKNEKKKVESVVPVKKAVSSGGGC